MKKLMICVLAVVMVCGFVGGSFACTGAREISMGAAGIAISDDSQATYWNPAALSLLKRATASYTGMFGDAKDDFRYDNVLSFAAPIGDKFGMGFQYVNSEVDSSREEWIENLRWMKIAAGYSLGKIWEWEIAYGIDVTFKEMGVPGEEKNYVDFAGSVLLVREDIFQKEDTLRLGMLVRRWNYSGGDNHNVRPGATYSFENSVGRVTVAASYYNLKGAFEDDDSRGPRIGFEQKIGRFAVRTGFDSATGYGGYFTGGLGYHINDNWAVDVAITDNNWGFIGLTCSW